MFQFPSIGFREGKVVTRTSFDVELDLQASQTKLSHLNDENSRLRELKQRLEEAKARGMKFVRLKCLYSLATLDSKR